ncbi:MAG TPA: type VI secretion protein IcmF/TssM N-terminal domain-containing protein, partial [Gemmatimonadales bacterium]|nr:type VI secretion protein IcmF/TssM N-terminal domain-containing protein [Gemmatimonadales bacterium]
MTRTLKIWLSAQATLAVFAVAVWFLGSALGLTGRDLWILRGGLWLLGAIATVAVAWFLTRRAPGPKPASAAATAEIDAAIAAARARLRSSRLAGRGAFDSLPVVLMIGPEGGAKTSSVIRSGLETELIAGDVFRGDVVAPTRLFNLWYTREGLILEAGGRLLREAPAWQRLLHHLLPRRFRSAFGGARQPARAAAVCLSCEELLKGAEAVTATAHALRARLGELTTALGVRLPTYVLFTKADALPHFTDYVRNFSRDEVRDAFGTTFPLDQMPPDSSVDQVFRLVDRAFQRLYQSLAAKRLKFLPRETAPEIAGSAYEFPREFRKVVGHATQFLVELSRPNQLEISPFLRGFYFTGVRPVVVTESALEAAAPVAVGAASPAARAGATSVFDPARLEQAVAGPRMTAMAGTSRRVPQWVFLERIFPQVILGDEAALGSTGSSRRVSRLRRLAAVAVILLALAAIGGLVVSYAGNRRLQADVAQAQRGLAEVPVSGAAVPGVPALRRLDAATTQLQRLAGYQRNGAPWGLRWGLYTGEAL